MECVKVCSNDTTFKGVSRQEGTISLIHIEEDDYVYKCNDLNLNIILHQYGSAYIIISHNFGKNFLIIRFSLYTGYTAKYSITSQHCLAVLVLFSIIAA